jgi:hypothetical protein
LAFAIVGVGQVEIVAVIAHHVHPVVGAVELQSCATLKILSLIIPFFLNMKKVISSRINAISKEYTK